MKIKIIIVVLTLFLSPFSLAKTVSKQFVFPIACELGKNCWIVNYFNHAEGPRAKDYHCGHLTYPKHKGTDIAVSDELDIAEGVPVLAAAGGFVKAIRNSEPDKRLSNFQAKQILDKECGNRVTIFHGSQWYTDYCHLRRGSIMVKAGDLVQPGQVIAYVGMSGKTAFPHLHFAIYHRNKRLDPFTGKLKDADEFSCDNTENSLWKPKTLEKLAYRKTKICGLGFVNNKPNFSDITRGWFNASKIYSTAPILGVWACVYGVNPGDKITLILHEPNGHVIFKKNQRIYKTQIRRYLFTAKNRRKYPWPRGKYLGEVIVKTKNSEEPLHLKKYLAVV